ncbi:hypothetical protein BJY52DRAFT_1189591 [Lactarius psammicola]|nr:hypothetical protein BJY52DRAFT_1189591 [Lactarius psammicola]
MLEVQLLVKRHGAIHRVEGVPLAQRHCKLMHVRLLDPASDATRLAVLDPITITLINRTTFGLDPLFKLEAALAA